MKVQINNMENEGLPHLTKSLERKFKHTLPVLNYRFDEFAPFMSAETLDFHYNKHHASYVDKVNELTLGTAFENVPLEKIVATASGALLEQASQAWNHSFFWSGISPKDS